MFITADIKDDNSIYMEFRDSSVGAQCGFSEKDIRTELLVKRGRAWSLGKQIDHRAQLCQCRVCRLDQSNECFRFGLELQEQSIK